MQLAFKEEMSDFLNGEGELDSGLWCQIERKNQMFPVVAECPLVVQNYLLIVGWEAPC